MRALLVGLLLVVARPVAAETRHIMERGETLLHVATASGCPVDEIQRRNHVNTTLLPAGTVVIVPTCGVRYRAQTREPEPIDDDDRARRALDLIDGRPHAARAWPLMTARTVHERIPLGDSQSVGQPWHGRLVGGAAFPDGDGYRLLRPDKAFGASHVVDHVRRAIAEVRRTYSDVHTLAIGDLSAEDGGPLGRHRSHQSGLDVDIGFYFTRKPESEQFVAANGDLDLEATWALIEAFASTANETGGVQMIFLDHSVQARLYRWAKSDGVSADKLATILQYPRGPDSQAGIVRHWPSHLDHIHVRFKPR